MTKTAEAFCWDLYACSRKGCHEVMAAVDEEEVLNLTCPVEEKKLKEIGMARFFAEYGRGPLKVKDKRCAISFIG
ncbi:hypothetical protein GTO91_00965 [Heliobacterium undosum]|uniref:Uncharacterized protein n=1 Tax=Heliomicrobium undosum TaxID=121734 RepID=A0A845L0M4_9FIRM|nr:hypothetical protein [Heliomicrobium undosum]MZP28294.1 hypothetical protein [Heliomicrobium undosum]